MRSRAAGFASFVCALAAGCRGSPNVSSTPDAGAAATSARATAKPLARHDGIVGIEPAPSCEPKRDDALPEGSVSWLAERVVQDRAQVLERELARWKNAWLGTYADDDGRAFVVVFHTDFADYETVRRRLETVMPPVRVVLRPACHSRERIAEAERILDERTFHPKAKSVNMLFYLDASFSGYSVSVDDSEVRQALERRLGKLGNVKLGSPGLQ